MIQAADDDVLAISQTCNKADQFPHATDQLTHTVVLPHTPLYTKLTSNAVTKVHGRPILGRRSNITPSLAHQQDPSKGWQSRAEEQLIGNKQLLMGK